MFIVPCGTGGARMQQGSVSCERQKKVRKNVGALQCDANIGIWLYM